jgi:hypothetical protein
LYQGKRLRFNEQQQERKTNMRNQNNRYGTAIAAVLVALAFACSSSLTAQTQNNSSDNGSIVGLWHVSLYLDPGHTQLLFESFKQWHSDGLEFESANAFPGAHCVGTWKQAPHHKVSLFHVGWTPNGAPGFPTAVRFAETESNALSQDGSSYDGSAMQTFYDQNGNALGTIPLYIHATRLTVH